MLNQNSNLDVPENTPYTILVVDDEASIRLPVCGVLERAGYLVHQAENLAQGQEMVKQGRPDLVLCDLYLTDGNGLELLRNLRRDAAMALTPFILMTGQDDLASLRQGMAKGADDYLRKPLTPAMLLDSVRGRLRHHESIKQYAAGQQAMLLDVIDKTPDIVLIVDPRSPKISYANKAARKLAEAIGTASHEGLIFDDFFGPENGAKLRTEFIPKVVENGTWNYEISGCHSGNVCYVLHHKGVLHPSRTSQDEFISVTARDITQIRKAEQSLYEERLLLRTLVDNLPVSVYAKDHSGKKILTNPKDLEFLGLSRESDVLGKTDRDILPADAARICQSDDHRVLQNGEPVVNREECLQTTDGGARWILTSKFPMRDGRKNIVGLIGIGRDITQERTAQAKMQQLWMAVEQGPASVVFTDLEGNIEYVNKRFTEVTGYSAEEAIGKNPRVLKSGNMSSEHYQEMWDLLVKGGEWHGEFQNRKKNGELFWESAQISPFRQPDGRVTHYLAIKQDITQQKEEERKRQEIEVQLRHAQKMQSIGQLAAGIAHEINTPTQFVGDNLRFLQDSFELLHPLLTACHELANPDAAQPADMPVLADLREQAGQADLEFALQEIPMSIQQSLDGVSRICAIVRAMKEFSHPGSEGKTPTDINKALATTITVSRNEWKYVAEVETSFDPDLPPVPCYPGEFNQVILNILVNAAHAIAEVVVEGGGKKGKIGVETHRLPEAVQIRISDNGAGIPDSVRERVFDPFFTTKGVGKGTGQGLAIAHSVIVDKHGGSISFETQPNQGTTFVIQLPLPSRS